jgi:pilus retraction protein PilT
LKNIHAFLDACLTRLTEADGQDLFLKVGAIPRIRVGGTLEPLNMSVLTQEDIEAIAKSLLSPAHQFLFAKNKSVDFAFSHNSSPQRFRGNFFFQQGTYSLVIRRLWKNIPSFEELRVPPVLKKMALSQSGIILIGGTVGAGKTTTIHAMIDLINQQAKRHVITVEDPIEYLHEDKQSIINQREIGQDADDFSSALRYVVRQSPNVVVIGEMRDADSFNFAVTGSEVGRLVISTIHAKSVVQIFDRILGFFPAQKHDVILKHLSFHINCFAVQKLLVKKDGKTFVPAFEVLVGDAVTRDLVAQNDFEKIPQALRNGKLQGMQTMNQALLELWKEGSIAPEEALAASDRPQELEQYLKGIAIDSFSTRILGA